MPWKSVGGATVERGHIIRVISHTMGDFALYMDEACIWMKHLRFFNDVDSGFACAGAVFKSNALF